MNEEYIMFNNYRKISLDEILEFIDKEGKLKFLVPTYIALPNIEATIIVLYIGKIIDMYGNKIKEIDVDILQWGSNTKPLENIEKRIFIKPKVLYKSGDIILRGRKEYYIAFQSIYVLYNKKGMEINEVKLSISKIEEMIRETKLEYLNEALNHLKREYKIIDETVNILDFWGIAMLYYMSEILKDLFGIDNYKIIIRSFYDMINLDKRTYNIFGYQLLSEYKRVKIRFRIYDASDIYRKESSKDEIKKYYLIDPYIALSLYSAKGYILFEEKQIKERFSSYPITLFEIDSKKLIEKLIEEKVINNEDDYVSFIGNKEYMDYIVNNIKDIYGL
jgi:hypothetical protein